MPRNLKIALGILIVAVLAGLISLRGLHRKITRLSESTASEEQARRELLAPPISTATDVNTTAKIYWAAGPDKLAPVDVQMALSADPVQRAKQVLHTLIADPPAEAQRTLPEDAALLAFYILPDGTGVADFSDTLGTETPSGILSEELAVGSITRTLGSNVPVLRRLKILIHGEEAETLAGHVDLMGFFDLNPPGVLPAPLNSAAALPAPGSVNGGALAPAAGTTAQPPAHH
ncbi:MAG: GerMN domain-containing protein [Candidatus Binataceae bacterium]